MDVRDIFETYGEAEFREVEKRVIQRLLTQAPGVVATGGGAFASAEIRAAVSDRGLSVWLDADLETLWGRVKDRTTRPLLQQPEPRKVLAGLLDARRPHYERAEVRVASDADVTHDEMVQRILKAVRSWDLTHAGQDPTLELQVVQ